MNDIIPFEFCNPNAVDLTYDGSQYYIPVLCAGNTSSLINIGENTEYYYYYQFSVSTAPLTVFGNSLLLYGKDRSMSNGLKICKVEKEEYLCTDSLSIQEPSNYDFPHYSIKYQDHLLVSYLFGESGGNGHNGLALIDANLNIKWQKGYNLDAEATYSFDLEESIDGNILISYNYRLESKFGSYAGVSMIDQNGEVIWDTRWDERTDAGSNIYHTQLSNGSILLSYEVDRWSDPVFIGNDWYRTPTRLLWLDDQGEFVKEKYILGPRTQEISLQNIDAGRGNYFFAYGFIEDVDNLRHGLITKYSNEGDTIWSRKVQHPDFSGLGHGHFIRDIIEHEDGTIAALARISTPGERSRIWLFELNEHGCFDDNEDCDDYVIVGETTDTTELEPPTEQELVLVPNPAQDEVIIKNYIPMTEAEITIYSADGSVVKNLILREDESIDISNLQQGVYFIQIKSNGISMIKKLVKW